MMNANGGTRGRVPPFAYVLHRGRCLPAYNLRAAYHYGQTKYLDAVADAPRPSITVTLTVNFSCPDQQ